MGWNKYMTYTAIGLGVVAVGYYIIRKSNGTVAFTGYQLGADGSKTNGGCKDCNKNNMSNFTGWMQADGDAAMQQQKLCNSLMMQLQEVRKQLENTNGLKPSELTAYRLQEMNLLSQLQQHNCA